MARGFAGRGDKVGADVDPGDVEGGVLDAIAADELALDAWPRGVGTGLGVGLGPYWIVEKGAHEVEQGRELLGLHRRGAS